MKLALRAAAVAGQVMSVIAALELFLYADHDLKIGSPINLDGDVWTAPLWFALAVPFVAALAVFFYRWHHAIEAAEEAAEKARIEAAEQAARSKPYRATVDEI